MASEDPTVAVEQPIAEEPAAVDTLPPVVNESDEPAAKPKKAPKEPKPRKPAARTPRTHPPYEEVLNCSPNLT